MGVHSLWDIVGPAARPVKLEALSRKRLAVDASIWIYQFMKAVRDKEGNSLGQTHIVGFFRRICKMLFFGMLPLFVFDGGAPPLKRQVIQARKERRQGNQESATNTAQKLLAMQMHRKAGHGQKDTKKRGDSGASSQTVPDGSETVYFDDMPMYHGDRPAAPPVPENQPSTFRRKDEYHLPELKQFTVRKGDQRIMPEGELGDYGEEHSWDVVDGISIDSVDPSSTEFAELPMATQYMILSHLRLRSRLRLGYSKDQLEHLFPNSRDFSKFQIQQVQKRNYYTQKLMNVSGMSEESGNVTRRIAGDKDRQYMLVKNEGGWTLSLGGDKNDEAIELDENGEVEHPSPNPQVKKEARMDDSDDDLEDVPLGGSPVGNAGAISPNPENSDDEMLSKALIESIYDQYKNEYDDLPEVQRHDQEVQQQIEGFRDTDLKKAIEESKKDYYQQKSKEEELTHKVGNDPTDEFELGQSLLFGADQNKKQASPEAGVQKPPSNEIVDLEDLPEEQENEVNSENEVEQKANTIPSWFNDTSHLKNPHTSIGFLAEHVETHKMDENEEAGLIPWNEAKKYFEETTRQKSDNEAEIRDDGSDSDLEIVKVSNPSQNHAEPPIENTTEALREDPSKSQDATQPSNSVIAKPTRVNPRKVFVQQGRRNPRRAPKWKSLDVNPRAESRPVMSSSKDNDSSEQIISFTENRPETAEPRALKKGNEQILDYDFDESEEEDLVKQLREEEQEHAQFTSSISLDKIPIHTKVSNEQLLQEQLQKAKRDAEEVTQTMINDVQELLKRFGIPYITAPMEAEAQCAELYRLGLVDGIVTDDSDCFLFGGSRIYKNMFNQKQYVECYIAEDIEHKVGLNQTKLIELALLLGSDYTEGVKGIGPVLAMEILAEYGSLQGFKQWFDETTKTLKKPESSSSKVEKTLLSRIKTGKLFLADSFPDPVVVDAYRRPEVDHDKSEFKWGVPSLDQIRSFLMYNVGWSQERVDEVMVPLIRNINKTRTEGMQTTISEFFPQEYISYRKDVGMGKRMKAAADRIRGE